MKIMALEFILEKECSFKKEYENDLAYALDLMQKTFLVNKLPGIFVEHAKDEIKSAKISIQGSENTRQTIEDVEKYLAKNDHSTDCRHCSANSTGLNYGCYSRMAYPISESFERKIIENLPSESTLAYELLIRAINDFPIAAPKALKEFRKKGFTESASPFQKALKKKSLFSSQKVSSDFFLNLLFFSGDLLQVSHMTMILLFLGVIPHNTVADELTNKEYIKSKLEDALTSNNFSLDNEMPLMRSMIIAVLIDEPLALLL